MANNLTPVRNIARSPLRSPPATVKKDARSTSAGEILQLNASHHTIVDTAVSFASE